jgi:hypothetical protein
MRSQEFGNDVEMLDNWIATEGNTRLPPMKMIMADGASLCIKCARENRDLLARTMQEGENEQWHLLGIQMLDYAENEESRDECANCYAPLNL